MRTAINPDIIALRERIDAQGRELSELRGNIQQLDKIVNATVHQSVWQLVVLIVTICGSIIGTLTYQTNVIEKRFEQIEKRIEISEDHTKARFDDLKQRIDELRQELGDLKLEVRARNK